MMRVLIVDDEPLARSAIRSMLRGRPDIEIAGECGSGGEAVQAIQSLSPDLVFLDVQMPELDGFAVLEAIDAEHLPHIIFVTAYDQYAVRAFEVHALDYLLKPFDRDRFEDALARAGHQDEPDLSKRIMAMLRESGSGYLQRLIVRTADRVLFLATAEIDWIEAQGNYVNLHGRGRTCLFREAITSLESRLDPRQFRRIHRSTIVNIDSIREMRAAFHGDYKVILKDGTELRLSHRFRSNLEKNTLGSL